MHRLSRCAHPTQCCVANSRQHLVVLTTVVWVSQDGWTPLIRAAYRGHADTVSTLCELGADTTAVTKVRYAQAAEQAPRLMMLVLMTLMMFATVSITIQDGFTARDMAEQAKRHDCVVAIDDISPGGKRQRRRF